VIYRKRKCRAAVRNLPKLPWKQSPQPNVMFTEPYKTSNKCLSIVFTLVLLVIKIQCCFAPPAITFVKIENCLSIYDISFFE